MEKVSSLKVRTTVKAGGWGYSNHNRALSGLKVRASVKAGGWGYGNHNRPLSGLKVRASVKAGGWGWGNHNRALTGIPSNRTPRLRRKVVGLALGLALMGGAVGTAGAGQANGSGVGANVKQVLRGGGWDGFGGSNHNRGLLRAPSRRARRSGRVVVGLALGLALGSGAVGSAGASQAPTTGVGANVEQVLRGGGWDGLGGRNHNRALLHG
jgi:hypothetical protein